MWFDEIIYLVYSESAEQLGIYRVKNLKIPNSNLPLDSPKGFRFGVSFIFPFIFGGKDFFVTIFSALDSCKVLYKLKKVK